MFSLLILELNRYLHLDQHIVDAIQPERILKPSTLGKGCVKSLHVLAGHVYGQCKLPLRSLRSKQTLGVSPYELFLANNLSGNYS